MNSKLEGLINRGNICYLNSALQVLYSIQPLREYLLTRSYKNDINVMNKMGHQGKYIETIADFFESYSLGNPNATKLLELISPLFSFGEQHDSHEVLTHLIDSMHEDVNNEGKSVLFDIFYGGLHSEIQCSHCPYKSETKTTCNGLELDVPKWSVFYSDLEKASLMTDVIVGIKGFADGKVIGSEIYISLPRITNKQQLITLVSKELKLNETDIFKVFVERNKLRRELFADEIVRLAGSRIEIHSKRNSLTMFSNKTMGIVDSLNQYFRPEQMMEWKCEKCNSYGGKKFITFSTYPQYFIMNVKLFEMGYYGCIKKTDYLTFPDDFEWVSVQPDTQNVKYEVVATINHIGCSFFGHYYSFIKNDGLWYCCNDESIKQVSQKDIHRKEAYIVVYKKV